MITWAERVAGPVSRSAGEDDRKAHKLPTTIPPQPSRRANDMHLRIVGSSTSESAVLGFSITNGIKTPGPQYLVSRNLNVPQSDISADFRIGISMMSPNNPLIQHPHLR